MGPRPPTMSEPPTITSKGTQRTKIEIRYRNPTDAQYHKQQNNIDHRASTLLGLKAVQAIRSRRACCVKR